MGECPDDDDDNNNNNNKHDAACAELHCTICKEIGVKLDTHHRCDHILKLVETGHGGKVITYIMEHAVLLTINRAA
jgi:hypothetical protein